MPGQSANKRLEAAIGIEPMNKGFADLCLTAWLRRLSKKGFSDYRHRIMRRDRKIDVDRAALVLLTNSVHLPDAQQNRGAGDEI